jgi:hypothetical protein
MPRWWHGRTFNGPEVTSGRIAAEWQSVWEVRLTTDDMGLIVVESHQPPDRRLHLGWVTAAGGDAPQYRLQR